jgi:dipeptidase
MKYKLLLITLFIISSINSSYSCTVIAVGKKATTDGSVIISHTDAGPDCRVHLVPGQQFKKGSFTPVHWGMVDLGRELGDYGEVLGENPQVEQTLSYFQTAYPQMNAYQLAIGESTLSQREELKG